MDVRIENRVGRNLVTKQDVCVAIYDVFLGKQKVASIGWQAGSKLIFTAPVSPVDQKHIEDVLPSLIDGQQFTSTPYPDIDPELVAGVSEEEEFYEFDED